MRDNGGVKTFRSSRRAPVDVVFDGGCGFCTRVAYRVLLLDRKGRVTFHPFQRPGVLERFGLTEEEARQAAWAFEAPVRAEAKADDDAQPIRYRGAAAVARALDAASGVRLATALYRVPPLGRLADRAYVWVAENRYRLRGTTPWCSRDPRDCGESAGPGSCAIPAPAV